MYLIMIYDVVVTVGVHIYKVPGSNPDKITKFHSPLLTATLLVFEAGKCLP